MRLIDADALLDGIYSDNPKDVMLYIANFPTVEPRKGKWVKAEQRGCWTYSNAYAECSCCHGEPTYLGWRMNYCPNCGADMRGSDA